LKNLPPAVIVRKAPRATQQNLGETDLETIQREHIAEIIRSENGNKVRAARALGVSRRTLYRLIERLDIEV
jgi:transcriptional regulator of acetoin/glycerol metabolism